MGKLDEKPNLLFQIPNLIIPRLHDQNLSHELAWVECSDQFIGASSGFAAMANFVKTHSIIIKIDGAYHNYRIPLNAPSLPFANDEQKLIRGNESVELLENLLVKRTSSEPISDLSKITTQNVNYTASMDERKEEGNDVHDLEDVEKMIAFNKFYDAEKALVGSLFRKLNSPSEQAKFHYFLACVQYYRKQFVEAKTNYYMLRILRTLHRGSAKIRKEDQCSPFTS